MQLSPLGNMAGYYPNTSINYNLYDNGTGFSPLSSISTPNFLYFSYDGLLAATVNPYGTTNVCYLVVYNSNSTTLFSNVSTQTANCFGGVLAAFNTTSQYFVANIYLTNGSLLLQIYQNNGTAYVLADTILNTPVNYTESWMSMTFWLM
jgi:hypothetical protein